MRIESRIAVIAALFLFAAGSLIAGGERQIVDRLPPSEIKKRMSRPIEESVNDPSLTREQKLDLVLRYHSKPGVKRSRANELIHVVMTQGMTNLEKAVYWSQQGNREKRSRERAVAAMRDDPESTEALSIWAAMLPLGRRYEREAAYLAALELDSTDVRALMALSSSVLMERPYESIAYCHVLIGIRGHSSFTYGAIGKAYQRLGDMDKALANFKAAAELSLHSPAHWILRSLDAGRTLEDLMDAQMEGMEKARRAAEAPPPAELSLANLPSQVARYVAAIKDLRDLTARYEQLTGKRHLGASDFGEWPETSSNFAVWRYLNLVAKYDEAGMPDEATSVFNTAVERFPDDRAIRRAQWQREQ